MGCQFYNSYPDRRSISNEAILERGKKRWQIQLEKLFFKKMTDAEIVSGGVFDIATTNSTTALVIKDVETTQGNNDDAIVASLSVGTAANRYNVQTYNKTVTVSGGNFLIDGTANAFAIDLVRRSTYIFDVSDSSNATHILAFSITSDGSHGGGSEYTTGVTRTVHQDKRVQLLLLLLPAMPLNTLHYYCTASFGMGGTSNTRDATVAEQNFLALERWRQKTQLAPLEALLWIVTAC